MHLVYFSTSSKVSAWSDDGISVLLSTKRTPQPLDAPGNLRMPCTGPASKALDVFSPLTLEAWWFRSEGHCEFCRWRRGHPGSAATRHSPKQKTKNLTISLEEDSLWCQAPTCKTLFQQIAKDLRQALCYAA